MFVKQRKWTMTSAGLRFREDAPLRLVKLGEQLETSCTSLLEGREPESERSYLGFGEGWVIRPGTGMKSSSESTRYPDAISEIRKFIQDWKEKMNFSNSQVIESGLMGYFDYEWGLYWQRPASSKACPRYFFRLCPINIVIIPESAQLVLEVFGEDQVQTESTFAKWQLALEENLPELTSATPGTKAEIAKQRPEGKSVTAFQGHWSSNMSRQAFLASVERIQEYIKAGDIFQAVFSQKFSLPVQVSEWEVYKKLRQLNPSPYLFCFKGDGETLVGSSPELLVSTVGPTVKTKPIAGTRPRGKSEKEDLLNEEELRRDIKENAEHAMLVDLGRNDLGRVSVYGSVKVSKYAEVERFSHVMHLVSTVEGKLAPSQDGLEALRATFPAGTLSGAPKVRAMEILQELEPETRGSYGGALGIIRWNGDVDFCITIRTLCITAKQVSVQAGGGIVYDSRPETEYEESLHKARALMKVVDECVNDD